MMNKVGNFLNFQEKTEYLSILWKSKGSGQKWVASINTNLHGVFGIQQFNKHVQELPFISRGCHKVPVPVSPKKRNEQSKNPFFLFKYIQEEKKEISKVTMDAWQSIPWVPSWTLVLLDKHWFPKCTETEKRNNLLRNHFTKKKKKTESGLIIVPGKEHHFAKGSCDQLLGA